MFNLINKHTGDNVDFWILTDSPFDQSRFQRCRRVSVVDMTIWVSSPEDIILAKPRWANLFGGSEKQILDALRRFEVQFGSGPALLNYVGRRTWSGGALGEAARGSRAIVGSGTQ